MDGLQYPVPSSIYHLKSILCYERSNIRPDAMDNIIAKRERIMFMLNNSRHHNVTELEKYTKEYLDVWIVLVTVLENQRTNIMSPFTFSSGWIVPSNNSKEPYIMEVWRFETIMIGILYASILFNIGMIERKSGGHRASSASVMRFIDAYSVLNGICIANIIAWKLRNEMKLPFECTENGCKFLMGMCLVEIQRHHIMDSKLSINWETRFKMSYWNYKKLEEISNYLSCRIKDRTIKNHFWIKYSKEYKRESMVEMYYYYIKHLETSNDIALVEKQQKIQFLCECLIKIIDGMLLRRSRVVEYIIGGKHENHETTRSRLNIIREEICDTESRYRDILNSNMINMIREEKNSDRDPRSYIQKNWINVFFYGTKVEGHYEKYNSYCGLDHRHAQELRGVIFYSS